MGTEELKVKFNKFDCIAVLSHYRSTMQNSLQLIDEIDGSPVAVASVNIPGEYQAFNEVFIKSWSENTGLRKILMEQEIIGPVIEYIEIGWSKASRHELLII